MNGKISMGMCNISMDRFVDTSCCRLVSGVPLWKHSKEDWLLTYLHDKCPGLCASRSSLLVSTKEWRSQAASKKCQQYC